MKHLLHRLRFLLPGSTRPETRPGFANLDVFKSEIDRYRKAGTKIGRKVRLMGHVDGINPHLISIGDYVVVGVGSALLAHCPIKGAAGCSIGNYVYLAYNVIILPGVSVGDYCIIGAGSVVTRDIPSGSIAAGNPARVLRSLSESEKANLIDNFEQDRLFSWSARNQQSNLS
jgi:acetyltransferase-like isoleucine patch superfamily enzyme